MNVVIIGTGKITEHMLDAARKIDELHIIGVMSRSSERGEAYARIHGLNKSFTTIQAAVTDPDVDAVYIASPNSCHYEQAMTAMRAGKHVLCENPIASNAQETQEMYEEAKAQKVVLLEAMRSIFDPGFQRIVELLPALGTIRRAAFQMNQYSSRYDHFKEGIIENAFQPALSNAAVMDIGVYCIHPCVRLFGMPESIQASSIFLHNGMEGMGTAILSYPEMTADIQYSKIHNVGIPSQIQGENATLLIDRIQDPTLLTLILQDGSTLEHQIEKETNNMYYELKEFAALVNANSVEHQYVESSIWQVQVVDEIRKRTGIKFR